VESVCQLQQAFKETINPCLRQLPGQGEREKGRDRFSSHRSDVAEPTCETAMADNFRSMPFPPEVHAFQTEIGRNQDFVTGGNSKDGAIVPDPGSNAAPQAGFSPDAGNQRLFRQRQDGFNI